MPDLFAAHLADRPRDHEHERILDALSIVVADVADLRPGHLATLADWTPAELRPAVLAYIGEHRPELYAEACTLLADVSETPTPESGREIITAE